MTRHEYRPYPNVVARGRGFAAFQPQRRFNRYLGVFATAEAAYCAVLEAQAEHLEDKARAYTAPRPQHSRKNGDQHER